MLILLFILILAMGIWGIAPKFDYLSGIPSSNEHWLYF